MFVQQTAQLMKDLCHKHLEKVRRSTELVLRKQCVMIKIMKNRRDSKYLSKIV